MTNPVSTPDEHKRSAPSSIGCWVLTISDSKTPGTDTSGTLVADTGATPIGVTAAVGAAFDLMASDTPIRLRSITNP